MKHTRNKTFVFIVFASLLLPTLSHAQPEKRAHIELLFFQPIERNNNMLQDLSEISANTYNALTPAHDLFSTATITLQQDIYQNHTYYLEDEYNRLNQSSEYKVLYRIAWFQPRENLGQATPIKLLPQRSGNFIDVTAHLFYNNLYKLELNVLYDLPSQYEETDTPTAQPLSVYFDRVMTHEKTYYLDHTLFGVLVRIVEFDVPNLLTNTEIAPATTSNSTIDDLTQPKEAAEDLINSTAE